MTSELVLSLLSALLLIFILVMYNRMRSFRLDLRSRKQELKRMTELSAREIYVSEAVLSLINLIRNSTGSVSALYDELLFNLSEKVGAGYACLMVYDTKRAELEVVSQYAYDKGANDRKWIKPGESLAGEVFNDGKLKTAEFPANYMKINSSLGHGKAVHLLLSPLTFNGIKIGIVELASFVPFSAENQKIISTVSESFAATLTSYKANVQNRELLEETQLQSESLKNKEIILQQTISELKDAQEKQEEHKRLSERRIEEHMESQKMLMEKIVKKYETSEKSLRSQIEFLEAELSSLKGKS